MALGSSKPVCYYQFENNAYDDSLAGNMMDGTVATGASFSTLQKVRGTYSFLNTDSGGTGCIHSCGTTADMAFFWTGVWTLSFWIYRSDTTTQYALGNQTSSGYGKYGFAVQIQNDQLGILMYPGGGGTWVYSDAGFSGQTGDTSAWHHLVITSDGTTIRFYGDGAEHGTGDTSYTTWPGSTSMKYKLMLGSIAYGSDSNPWTANYLGYMDEVSIWDACATDEEVESLYNGGASRDLRNGLLDPPPEPPPEMEVEAIGGIAPESIKTIAGINVASIKTISGVSPAPSWTPTPWANAYSIDFTAAAHASTDRLDLPNNADFDFEYTDAFSISLWFKFTSIGWASLIGKVHPWGGTWTAIKGWQILCSAGEIGFWVTNAYQSNGFQAMTTSAFNDGNWHNLVAIKCAACYTAASAEIWIDGVSQATDYYHTNTTLSNTIVTTADIIVGGGAFGGWGSGFDGNLDEVGIWSKALSSGEVADIYNSGTPANLAVHSAASNLVSYWRNGDGSDARTGLVDSTDSSDASARIYDMSANSHAMTPVNLSAGDKVEDVPT